MSETMEGIARAEGEALEALLNAVLRRYAVVYPDWEMNMIALSKGDDRNVQIDRIVNLLLKMKTAP